MAFLFEKSSDPAKELDAATTAYNENKPDKGPHAWGLVATR